MGKKQVNIRLETDVIEQYERLAQEHDRDRTYFMTKALKTFVKEYPLETQAKPSRNPVGKRFVPPTVSQVAAYFVEAGLDQIAASLQAENFVNFYESKGWLVGKTKMQVWKGAAANWLARLRESTQPGTTRGMSLERELTDKSWAGDL